VVVQRFVARGGSRVQLFLPRNAAAKHQWKSAIAENAIALFAKRPAMRCFFACGTELGDGGHASGEACYYFLGGFSSTSA
jgi:hypothetical protein